MNNYILKLKEEIGKKDNDILQLKQENESLKLIHDGSNSSENFKSFRNSNDYCGIKAQVSVSMPTPVICDVTNLQIQMKGKTFLREKEIVNNSF